MEEPVITQRRISDKIVLEGKYNYSVNLTIGLAEGGDFYLIIEFKNLIMEDLKILAHLSKSSGRLKINSELIEKEKYNITHIVVTKYNTTNDLQIIWECLSDDPDLYKNLIIK